MDKSPVETIIMASVFLVLCLLMGMLYCIIRGNRIVALVYLFVAIFFLSHSFLIYLAGIIPGLLPESVVQYCTFWLGLFI
jgi:hypothetical protein